MSSKSNYMKLFIEHAEFVKHLHEEIPQQEIGYMKLQGMTCIANLGEIGQKLLEYSRQFSKLALGKHAKITNTVKQKSDNGKLKYTQNFKKSKYGQERDRKEHVMCER